MCPDDTFDKTVQLNGVRVVGERARGTHHVQFCEFDVRNPFRGRTRLRGLEMFVIFLCKFDVFFLIEIDVERRQTNVGFGTAMGGQVAFVFSQLRKKVLHLFSIYK